MVFSVSKLYTAVAYIKHELKEENCAIIISGLRARRSVTEIVKLTLIPIGESTVALTTKKFYSSFVSLYKNLKKYVIFCHLI
jgi:hypothetical protein